MSFPIPSDVLAPYTGTRIPVDVCPHCKRQLTLHRFNTDGFTNVTYHCQEHGDVKPMRSLLWNEY